MATITVEVSDETAQKFVSIATDHGTTREQLLREAVELFVQQRRQMVAELMKDLLERDGNQYERLA